MSTSKDHPRSRPEPEGQPDDRQSSTPPEVAERYRVSSDTVRGWIVSGQLRAIDISTKPGHGKPRWRILACDLAAFENQRAGTPPVKVTRRRRKPKGIVDIFDGGNHTNKRTRPNVAVGDGVQKEDC